MKGMYNEQLQPGAQMSDASLVTVSRNYHTQLHYWCRGILATLLCLFNWCDKSVSNSRESNATFMLWSGLETLELLKNSWCVRHLLWWFLGNPSFSLVYIMKRTSVKIFETRLKGWCRTYFKQIFQLFVDYNWFRFYLFQLSSKPILNAMSVHCRARK